MELKDVLAGCGAEPVGNARANVPITGISQDTRRLAQGEVFVALPGTKVDGLRFVAEAVQKGTSAVIAEKPMALTVPTFVVPSARKALACLAANFYGNPAKELTLLGITGTNGKTTTAHLIEA